MPYYCGSIQQSEYSRGVGPEIAVHTRVVSQLPSRWMQNESQRGKYWPLTVCSHNPAGGTDSAFEYPLQRRITTSDELMAKAMSPKQPDQTNMVLMRLCEQRNVACRLAVEHRFVALFEVEGDAGAETCEDWLTVIFDALLLW
ncbi:hypothetical protein LTR48_004988 [Friedmanniomyces endolithicus]|uniref:Uncharacterized protein n=2 Tax=Dothideomycetidae TaxID=451867 RepID=A0A4U0VFK4_9PEZI|nr:hypothetical protein LTS09_014650 [Friedmanniomyces endolithicus]KAK0940555.1 hypothetical protein LTR29_007877 [Friedmanniomyces endolithicus]KAK1092102.1 hypothetical protein LTR48_004988 [Friedmanniomyces endolithicus]KAK5142958.1 hypothetical protein LTR32_004807 [Rachicladosporium monterosium]TKA47947.1 hypothetical protein B0A54_01437 [Friedmanniomyces endolithicus]